MPEAQIRVARMALGVVVLVWISLQWKGREGDIHMQHGSA